MMDSLKINVSEVRQMQSLVMMHKNCFMFLTCIQMGHRLRMGIAHPIPNRKSTCHNNVAQFQSFVNIAATDTLSLSSCLQTLLNAREKWENRICRMQASHNQMEQHSEEIFIWTRWGGCTIDRVGRKDRKLRRLLTHRNKFCHSSTQYMEIKKFKYVKKHTRASEKKQMKFVVVISTSRDCSAASYWELFSIARKFPWLMRNKTQFSAAESKHVRMKNDLMGCSSTPTESIW